MNFKKGISVMLASTAISMAISGVTSACPGLEFAIGDQLFACELMRRQVDGALYPAQNNGLQINVPPMNVGDICRFVFYVNNPVTNASLQYLGCLGHPVNDVPSDYTVRVQVTGGTDNINNQPIVSNMGPNGVPGLVEIRVAPVDNALNALVVEFQAQGQCNVQGQISINSNTSNLPLHIPFSCTVI